MTPATMEFVDVPVTAAAMYWDGLRPGRTLRVGVISRDGRPHDLLLAVGWGTGASWREDTSEGISLPASCLPDLLDALRSLHAGSQALPDESG